MAYASFNKIVQNKNITIMQTLLPYLAIIFGVVVLTALYFIYKDLFVKKPTQPHENKYPSLLSFNVHKTTNQ